MKRFITKLEKNKFLKNILVLLQGNILVSVLSMINLAILIRAIGVEANGIIFIAQSYSNLFNDIFNFQSTTAIIKYVPLSIKDKYEAMNYIKLGYLLDIATAVLGFIMGILCINFVANIMDWNNYVTSIVLLNVIIIAFRITGTSIGVLRVFDKFKETVYVNFIEVVVKLVLYIICFILNANIFIYVFIDILISIITLVLLSYYSFKVLKENGLHEFYKQKTRFDKEFFKFNLYTNMQVVLDMPVWHLTPFVINKFLGFEQIAIYKVIEKIGAIISRVTTPVAIALYPEISKKISENKIDEARKINKKIMMTVLGFGSIAVFVMSITSYWWIVIFIPRSIESIITLILYLIFLVYSNSFMGQHPLFIYLGHIRYIVPILIITNIIYIILLVILTIKIGVIGIVIARIIQATLVFIIKEFILRKYSY